MSLSAACALGVAVACSGDANTDASKPSVDAGGDAGFDADFDAGSDGVSGEDAEETSPGDAGACGNLPSVSAVGEPATPELALNGVSHGGLGVYDPSLFYPVGAPGGVLSYSAVNDGNVSTQIAVSADHGASFTYVAAPNAVTNATLSTTDDTVCGATSCPAVLWHEVPSIIADPADADASKRFKLFVHTYAKLTPSGTLRRDWGYIGMQTAPAPEGPWSTEQNLLGWKSSSTFSSQGAAQTLTDLPDLADCIAFTEPGATVSAGGIDLALTCIAPVMGTREYRIVLLHSDDSAKTFRFVATLLEKKDAVCIDGVQLNAPDLFWAGGRAYLVVTPVGSVTEGLGGSDGYRGCVTIPFADITTGTLERTPTGAPVVTHWIQASDGRFTGPCTYAEGASAIGYLVPQLYPDQPPRIFRILATAPSPP